jgi:hypothetical protein
MAALRELRKETLRNSLARLRFSRYTCSGQGFVAARIASNLP